MNRTQAKVQVMFFDACHSGATKDKSGAEGMAADLAAFIDQQSDGRVILSSCGLNEVAYEDDQSEHGVFTRYLLEGLKGNADQDADGMVSASEVSAYTSQKVKAWAFNNNKTQNPRMSANISGQILLTVNREGERLAQLSAERSQLEQQLAETKQQLDQAQQADDALSEVEAKQRQAELQEKVRQAKAAEALERRREEAARQDREKAARQQRQQSIQQAAAREQARQEQAEIQRKKQQLEAERQKLQAQQLESMDIGQLLQKAKELQDKIDGVGPEVRAEVDRQVKAIPQPGKSQVDPKDEFETRAMYQKRLNQARQADKEKQQRYQREVSQVRSSISGEIKSRSQGYQDALALLNREIVLDETQLVLDLGRYDPENQVFANASLSAKSSRQVQSLDWPLKVPLSQAKQFKQSVENGTVKIRAEVKLKANRQQAVIDSAVIEDLVQNLSYQKTPVVRIIGQDEAEMVLIPAGGSVSSFVMDKYEVTNAQYGKFMRSTGHREPEYWDNSKYNQSNQPVIGVSWEDAVAYAKWAGKRLPTEKEWEWAARGGLRGKEYPWGDQEPTSSRANYDDKVGKPTAVGSYPANGYGLYDMDGNVWEWCQDWYDSDRDTKVLRGGSWYSATGNLRLALRNRYAPLIGISTYGFRCVSGSN